MLQPFLDLFFSSGTIVSIEKDRLLIGFGTRKWMKEIEDESKPAFYFPDFFLENETPWFQQEFCFEVSVASFLEELSHQIDHQCSLKWTPPDKSTFQWGFNDLMQRFSNGELSKGVPYVFETSNEPMNPSQLHHSLLSLLRFALARPIFCYGFWDCKEGLLGASPELLYKLEKGERPKLKTAAIAGTMGHHRCVKDFINDPKELDEHGKVVKGIEESLTPFGKVNIGKMGVLDLGSLSHFITPIEANLNDHPDYDSLVKALHPTPALGAFPKKEGMKWLMSYQSKSERGRYGAPVGAFRGGGDEACFYVAIRGIQWNEKGISIGAGCGVVSQSKLENEWNEINCKIDSVKEVFSIA